MMVAHALVHVEIPGTDRQATAQFYQSLFGWQSRHNAALDYTTFDAAPGPGGAYVVADGTQARAGEILLHFSTADLDATLQRALDLGGTLVAPKLEIPGIVWVAIFADPSGNRIAIIQNIGEPPPPDPAQATAHPIVFIEIPAQDPQAAATFYHALFGWEVRSDPAMNYTGCAIGPAMGSGFPAIDGQATIAGRPRIYAATDDVARLLARAVALGGQVFMPPMAIPGVGWIGFFGDPDGTPIGLLNGAM